MVVWLVNCLIGWILYGFCLAWKRKIFFKCAYRSDQKGISFSLFDGSGEWKEIKQ